MKAAFKRNQQVRIVGERVGGINEFGRVDSIKKTIVNGECTRIEYFVTNLNMPYQGTISKWMVESEIS